LVETTLTYRAYRALKNYTLHLVSKEVFKLDEKIYNISKTQTKDIKIFYLLQTQFLSFQKPEKPQIKT